LRIDLDVVSDPKSRVIVQGSIANSEDAAAGVASFVERREPAIKGG
jgi:hypothetical protein